jgi:L-alanine-DL-glutamate epimerase-like enolase superfamily enzyme
MLKLELSVKRWTMVEPFIISSGSSDYIDSVWVTVLDEHGHVGRAETCGVDYHGETAKSICQQIEAVRNSVEAGIELSELQQLLPAGGARNGLDCALWDLHCSVSGRSIWEETGLRPASSTGTAYTIGVVDVEHARELATKFRHNKTLKIKVDESGSLATMQAVRAARPDARIIIDANQAWTWEMFQRLEPDLLELDVALVEQPFAVGEDDCLLGYQGGLKIAADESVQTTADLAAMTGRYDVINIKLDKTGGMTEALCLASRSRSLGFGLMIGNNCGSSLAMAPGYVIAQLCEFVDLDGPLLQTEDIEPCLVYSGGNVSSAAGGGVWAGV